MFLTGRELPSATALDLERSRYRNFPSDYFIRHDRGQIASLEQPVLKAHLLASVDIIRVIEFDLSIFVSERFVSVFQDQACTGMTFRSVGLSHGPNT